MLKEFNSNPPPHYQDIRVAAGVFKFNPEKGYPLTRRQIALAYVNRDTDNKIQLELWEQLPPITPGFHQYADVALDFCHGHGEANSISLVAGNFAGVQAKQPDTPPVWGLAVAYESANPTEGVAASVFRVDQGVDWNNSVFPLTAASRLTVPKQDTACSSLSRNVLVAFDYDGDSLYLGAPVHFVLNDVQHFDYMLQEPPKHVDYLPNAVTTCTGAVAHYQCNGIVNVSEFDGFNITYGTSATDTVSHEVQKNSSWNVGGSVAFSAQNTVGEDVGIENVRFTLDFKAQIGYDYGEHQASYTGKESSYTVTQESVTSADDALSFQTRTTDIWRYRIYGMSPIDDKGQPIKGTNGFYEIALPRALCISDSSTDPDPRNCPVVSGGGKTQSELYQPWHENWNILSYPNADTEFHPTDIGPWTRPTCDTCNDKCTGTTTTNCCAPNADDSSMEDCTTPLAPSHGYSWDGTAGNEHIQLDSSLSKGSSTEWTSKFSEDINVGIGWKFSTFFGADTFTGCVDVDFHSDQSWGQLSNASSTTTLTSDIILNKPNGNSSQQYNFFPTLYVDTKGAMRAVHSVTIPTTLGFWHDWYQGVDPALNLPKKFSDAPDPNFKQFNTGSDAKEMRGFLLRNGKTDSTAYGTMLACGPVTLNDLALNNQVLLEARIYNYSIGSTVSNVPVRFDVVELDDQGEECRDATACLTRTPLATVPATCTNPYNVSNTMCDSPVSTQLSPRGMGLAHYILDISTLPLPSMGLSNPFRFYVVVDPDNTIDGETHEWRQPTVVLTPALRFNPGEQFCVDVQGTNAEQICYTVLNSTDDITQKLTDAINASQTATQYGLQATKIQFDPSNPNESAQVIAGAPHVEITLTNPDDARLPHSTEFRAGIQDAQNRAFYFVPTTKNLTATNDQPGQNNEGFGARTLTVSVPTAAELLGGGDPCKGSDSLDLSLTSASLAAIDRDGTAHIGRVQVIPGQSLRLQFTAFANDDTATCEQTQLFLGHPANGGTHLATRMISGVDAIKGGRTWHPWRAPDTPGLYTLYARLHERPTDTQVGNNLARLDVLVVEPPNPNGTMVSTFTGTARHVGSGRANGTVSLSGTVAFAGALNLSAATLTLSQLLNEQHGNGELAQGANGRALLPLTLLPAPRDTKGPWATFETPAGVEPRVKAKVKQRHARKGDTQGEWEVTLTAEDTLLHAAAGCSDAPRASTRLTTQLTLNDGTHVPVVMHTTQSWRCGKQSLKAS